MKGRRGGHQGAKNFIHIDQKDKVRGDGGGIEAIGSSMEKPSI